MFFKMTNTAIAAMTYARQWDLLDYTLGRFHRFRSVAAPVPPDMLEALRLTQLQVEMYEQTTANMIAFMKTQGLSPTGRKSSEPVFYAPTVGRFGASFTIKEAAEQGVAKMYENMDFAKVEKRVLAGMGYAYDLFRYGEKYEPAAVYGK
ncbi:hypothetical protein JXVLWARM_CDS_0109 [Burkholderia phage Bm1]